MEFYEAVRKRRTVREFDGRPVEEEKLKLAEFVLTVPVGPLVMLVLTAAGGWM